MYSDIGRGCNSRTLRLWTRALDRHKAQSLGRALAENLRAQRHSSRACQRFDAEKRAKMTCYADQKRPKRVCGRASR